jgi:hypothetical protein
MRAEIKEDKKSNASSGKAMDAGKLQNSPGHVGTPDRQSKNTKEVAAKPMNETLQNSSSSNLKKRRKKQGRREMLQDAIKHNEMRRDAESSKTEKANIQGLIDDLKGALERLDER